MDKPKHNREPWLSMPNGACFNLQAKSENRHHMICIGMVYQSDGEHAANILRICQCVNALAGIDDPKTFILKAKVALGMVE